MAKLTKEELSKRINDLEIDDDLKISLMEDIADSFTDESEEVGKLKEDITRIEADYNALKEKYKSRFYESEEKENPVEDEQEEVEEEKVIDIKEI
ncbi:MAG: hypothetical protein J6T10_21515 [Methanobrevibacter sp.]|nr:hypothetical protein [Methanobrevibacter sp.]